MASDLSDYYEKREEWKRATLRGPYSDDQLQWKRRDKKMTGDVPEPNIPESALYAHILLLAMTRFGKTNAIAWRINQLLSQISVGAASAIIMEPKGILTEDILHLASVWDMRDRVILIDPADPSITINLFDRDGTVDDTVQRVTRILRTLTTDMTAMQRDTFTLAITALYHLDEEPTLRTLMNILRKGKDALSLDRMPEEIQDFFQHDFRQSDGRFVIGRLRSLLSTRAFRDLFGTTRTNFDMSAELQKGRLILIKASGQALSGQVALYGRFWIEQVARTIWPRMGIDEDKRVPTTFIIDEAQYYIAEDEYIASVLDTAAEAKLSLMFALHHMEQIKSNSVRQSIYTNTSVKFSSRTSADIYYLSRSLGDADNLPKLLPKLPKYHFILYTPDHQEPERVKFPKVDFKTFPRITDAQYREFRQLNRARYAVAPEQPSSASAPPPDMPIEEPTEEPVRRKRRNRFASYDS